MPRTIWNKARSQTWTLESASGLSGHFFGFSKRLVFWVPQRNQIPEKPRKPPKNPRKTPTKASTLRLRLLEVLVVWRGSGTGAMRGFSQHNFFISSSISPVFWIFLAIAFHVLSKYRGFMACVGVQNEEMARDLGLLVLAGDTSHSPTIGFIHGVCSLVVSPRLSHPSR